MTDMDCNDETNGNTRDELVQRIALMEAMIAEGRQTTGRFGWIFVLWGLVDIAGVLWQLVVPRWFGPWPILITVGMVLQVIGLQWFNRGQTPTLKNRAVSSVWRVMGVTLCLYCFSGALARHGHGIAYAAAIFMIVGMAHSISAMILRWGVQGAMGALWLGGGVASYFVPGAWLTWIFLFDMTVGMVLFGLYAMLLERRRAASTLVMRHG